MKTGLGSQAFTIVETLIVLAVSALILIASLKLVAGQQAKTQFYLASHDIQTRVDAIIDNVTDGFDPITKDFGCVPTATGPSIVDPSSLLYHEAGNDVGCV